MKLTILGDIMAEIPVLRAAKCRCGKYDFKGVFDPSRKLLAESDYIIGNLETPLAGEEAKYSDVIGDDAVNVLDLVRQKKNIANEFTLVDTKEGTMALNGNTAYAGEFVSKMGTGAEYKVAFSYKSDSAIKIKINSMGEEPIVIEKAAANDLTAVEEVIKTPLEFAENGIEFQIIGQGEVSEISVIRTNMDNEYSENW